MLRDQSPINVRPVLPDYGVFLHWPESGHAWIHPDDVAIVSQVIPSDRVYRRSRYDGVFYHYDHGTKLRFRTRPAMWLPLPCEGLDVGDLIEIRSLGLARETGIARIQQMRYCRRRRIIQYHISSADGRISRIMPASYLRPLAAKYQLRSGDMGHTPARWQRKIIEPGIPLD